MCFFFFSSRRRHTRCSRDWSSDVCSSDLGFGSEALQFLRGQHSFESVHQRREGDGQPDVVKQPAQVFQRVRHALQEMSLALVKSAKAVSAQRSEEHTSELQSRLHLVCRLLLEKKKKKN